jgi:hypothetical protein
MKIGGWLCVGMLAMAAGCSGHGAKAERLNLEPGWSQLFNGRDLGGWRPRTPGDNKWMTASEVKLDPQDNTKFKIIPGSGILVNGPTGKTTDIYTILSHADCELHIEFTVPKGSNSGVYFQGRYEVQVFDSFGKDKEYFGDCGGIYARWINGQDVGGEAPRKNVSKAPGEWQSFDVKFTAAKFDKDGHKIANARFDWVKHNGVLVHENYELDGPTRAAMDENKEVHVGPLMLQGDHGPVAYRNIRMKLIK